MEKRANRSVYINEMFYVNKHNQKAKDYANELEKKLREMAGIKIVRSGSRHVIIIVVGGDGTMLSTINTVINDCSVFEIEKPLLGINPGGSIGFMMNDAIPVKDVAERISQGKFEIVEFPLLKITSNGKTAFALNDFYFRESGPHASKFYVKIDGKMITDKPIVADGVAISASLGSTAYNLSANGPVVSVLLPSICLTPICSHSPRIPPMVLHPQAEIEIEILYFDKGEIRVFKDSSELFGFGSKIKIKLSDKKAQLAFFEKPDFIKRLNDKILSPQR